MLTFEPKKQSFFNKVYNNISSLVTRSEQKKLFYNHGYFGDVVAYDEEDIKWKNNINLYLHLLDIAKLKDKNISLLDIGCGLGYGTHTVKKYYDFYFVHGIDIIESAIKHAKRNWDDVTFSCEDACKISFTDNMFDVVLNVESNHCYRYKPEFYKQVKKILKPNGYYLMTDAFKPEEEDIVFEQMLKDENFYIAEKRNITDNVILSLNDEIKYFNSRHNLSKSLTDSILSLYQEKKEVYETGQHNYFSYIIRNKK